jgi:hypothetical protein
MAEIDLMKVKRLRNLRIYRGLSDEEIIEKLQEKEERLAATPTVPTDESDADKANERRFRKLLTKLRTDYSIDMNDSNDAQALTQLVRLTLQSEQVDKQINRMQQQPNLSDEDVRTLKNLGDFQRSVNATVNDLQDKLGISRKLRKEKQADDIPQYIAALQRKAKDFWDRKTVGIKCENCQIELGRYWINFPNRNYTVRMELECAKCLEKIVYVR